MNERMASRNPPCAASMAMNKGTAVTIEDHSEQSSAITRLPTKFKPRKRGDNAGEGFTHADGIIGTRRKGHDSGPVDGILGPSTRAALQAFQKSEGLDPSGRLDRGTLEKLGVQLTQFIPKQPVRKPPMPAQPK